METTKEKILEAAEHCPDAKATLKILFPEVFEDEDQINTRLLVEDGTTSVFSRSNCQRAGVQNDIIQIRTSGEYKNKAFYLNDSGYNWEMKKDSVGSMVLIPTRRC